MGEHVIRMKDSRPAMRALLSNLGDFKSRERPTSKWEGKMEADTKIIGSRCLDTKG